MDLLARKYSLSSFLAPFVCLTPPHSSFATLSSRYSSWDLLPAISSEGLLTLVVMAASSTLLSCTVLVSAATSPVTLSSLAVIVAVFYPIDLRKNSAVSGSPGVPSGAVAGASPDGMVSGTSVPRPSAWFCPACKLGCSMDVSFDCVIFGCGVLLMFNNSNLPLFRIGEADLSCSLPDDALPLQTALALTAGGDPIVDGGATIHSSNPREEMHASKLVDFGAGDQMGGPSVPTEGGRWGLAVSARTTVSVREAPLSSAVLKGPDRGDPRARQLSEGCAGGGALHKLTIWVVRSQDSCPRTFGNPYHLQRFYLPSLAH